MLKYGLVLRAYESIDSLVEKSFEAEKAEFDCLWICDRPSDLYSPTVASVIASKTSKMNLGLGFTPLLHTPKQISGILITLIKRFGERFELCLIPGDKFQLNSVGINFSGRNILEAILQAKNQVRLSLDEENLQCKIRLGAQGPRMIKLAPMFDGVLLNFASVRMISWALENLNEASTKKDFEIGIMAPSYIYTHYRKEIHGLLQISSATVALGATAKVKKKLGWFSSQPNLTGNMPDLKSVPDNVAAEFSIFMPSESLGDYASKLEALGISRIVFAYPQDHSPDTIRGLQGFLRIR